MAEMVASTNVKVAVRLRPLSARERLDGADELIQSSPHSGHIHAGPEHSFAFDSVFGPDSSQSEVFEGLVRPSLDSFVGGFNCTILAYGQVSASFWEG